MTREEWFYVLLFAVLVTALILSPHNPPSTEGYPHP